LIFNFNDTEVTESPVVNVYEDAAVQSDVPSTFVPAVLKLFVGTVVYEPEPDEAADHQKLVASAADEEMALVPGTAAFAVANEVDGAEVTRARTVTESPIAVPDGNEKVTVTEPATPARKLAAEPNETAVGVCGAAAVAGATEDKTPRPKAATATSATRLKVVFVDICFLSISRAREFPVLGFELIS